MYRSVKPSYTVRCAATRLRCPLATVLLPNTIRLEWGFVHHGKTYIVPAVVRSCYPVPYRKGGGLYTQQVLTKHVLSSVLWLTCQPRNAVLPFPDRRGGVPLTQCVIGVTWRGRGGRASSRGNGRRPISKIFPFFRNYTKSIFSSIYDVQKLVNTDAHLRHTSCSCAACQEGSQKSLTLRFS